MTNMTGLRRRGARYYVRRRVPLDLVEDYGRPEISYSLGTADPREARRRVRAELVKLDADFARRRRRLQAEAPTPLTDTDILHMVVQWFWNAERDTSRAEAAAPLAGRTLGEVLSDLDGVEVSLRDPESDVAEAHAVDVADRLLQGAGARLARASCEYGLLVQMVRRAMLEGVSRGRDRLMGDHSGRSHDPAFQGVNAEGPRPGPSTATAAMTIRQLADKYMAEREAQRAAPRTLLDLRSTFDVVCELVGPDVPADQVTRAQMRRVRDVLSRLPPNARKRWSRVPLADVADMAGQRDLEPMNPRTANGYLARASTLFEWAIQEEYALKNPAKGLKVPRPETPRRERRNPFSQDQLQRIFGHDTFAPGNGPRGASFWLPILGLYTGARLNELCGLEARDVRKVDGVYCIQVRKGKTASAHRTIPIHGEVVRLGFLGHVKAVKANGGVRLFPEVQAASDGYHSSIFSKRFRWVLEAVGAKTSRNGFHSFRHTMTDALREAGVPPDRIRAVMGWSGSGMEEAVYGGGLRPSTLAKEVNKVRYEGLDLAHLYQP